MSDTNAEANTRASAMSKEDIAFIIRARWDGFLKPTWPRKLLISYGLNINDKIPLSKMEAEQLNALLPHLSTVAEHLGKCVGEKMYAELIAFLKAAKANQAIMEEAEKLKPGPLSREEIAYYIKAMWDADLKPNWEKDDLIDLGMAVFTKTTLAKIDQKKLGKLLPSLSIAAEAFGQQVAAKFAAKFDPIIAMLTPVAPIEVASEPAPAPTPAQLVEQEPVIETAPAEPSIVTETPAQEPVVEQIAEATSEPPSEQPVVDPSTIEPQGETHG